MTQARCCGVNLHVMTLGDNEFIQCEIQVKLICGICHHFVLSDTMLILKVPFDRLFVFFCVILSCLFSYVFQFPFSALMLLSLIHI